MTNRPELAPLNFSYILQLVVVAINQDDYEVYVEGQEERESEKESRGEKEEAEKP